MIFFFYKKFLDASKVKIIKENSKKMLTAFKLNGFCARIGYSVCDYN